MNRIGRNTTQNLNRAEDLRGKRTQRSQERSKVVNNRAVKPSAARPVTVRGSTYGTPIHRQANTRARRQFYVTMDPAAGTEMRLPALPMIHPGWRLISGLIAILAAVGIFSLWGSPFFQVNAAEVNGLQRLTAEEINKTLNLADTPIIAVNARDLHDTLAAAYPALVDIQVQVGLPNQVTITAAERAPVLAVQNGDQTTWVDAQGVAFPAQGDAGSLATLISDDNLFTDPGLPITAGIAAEGQTPTEPTNKNVNSKSTTGGLTERTMDTTLLAATQELSQKLPEGTQLVYSKQDGLGWNDPAGWQVFIGKDLSDYEAKYALVEQVTRYLNDNGKKPTLISVVHLNAPFYRLEQ